VKISPRIVYLAAAGLVAWFGLALQSWVGLEVMWGSGYSTLGALVKLLSYFTILTNGLVALCYVADFIQAKRRERPSPTRIRNRSGVAVSIVMVGLGYELLLRRHQHFEGWPFVANFMVHDATPFLFIIYWTCFTPKGALRWRDPLFWILYPAIYLPSVLAYAAATSSYPYPFLDVGRIGWSRAVWHGTQLLIAFAVMAWLLVMVDRFWPFKPTRST
jgi:hypothetical protein